MGAVLCGVCDN